MVICLERGADLRMAQRIPLPLTVSCFSKIHVGFTFLVTAHPGSPGQRAVKRARARACVHWLLGHFSHSCMLANRNHLCLNLLKCPLHMLSYVVTLVLLSWLHLKLLTLHQTWLNCFCSVFVRYAQILYIHSLLWYGMICSQMCQKNCHCILTVLSSYLWKVAIEK